MNAEIINADNPRADDPVLQVCKGGSLEHAYEAAEAFAEECGGALPVSIMKTHPEDTEGTDDPFLRHDHHVNVIIPGDEPRRVNFVQMDMADGSTKIVARHGNSVNAKFDFIHSAAKNGSSIAAFGKRLSGWILSLGTAGGATATA